MSEALKQVTDACAEAAAATDPAAYYAAQWWEGAGMLGFFALALVGIVAFTVVMSKI